MLFHVKVLKNNLRNFFVIHRQNLHFLTLRFNMLLMQENKVNFGKIVSVHLVHELMCFTCEDIGMIFSRVLAPLNIKNSCV